MKQNNDKKLTSEVRELRQRVAELEASDARRKQAEEALQESERRLDLAVTGANLGLWDWDVQTGRAIYSRRWAEMLGYSLNEIEPNASTWKKFIHAEDSQQMMEILNAHFEGKNSFYEAEFRMQTKAGDWKWILSAGKVFEWDNVGKPSRMTGLHIDITERKLAEEQIKKSLEEKEVLLREIHHRVKNNMQVISSLLSLQSRYLKDEQTSELLKESQSRIRSMALIHEKLYKSKDLASVDFKDYLKSLAKELFRFYKTSSAVVALQIAAEDVLLGVDQAIPCGLIINELLSNSLKYAFPDNRNGKINISIRYIAENEIELIVSDDGVGLPKELDFRNTESLGLHLVTVLAEEQLMGKIKLDNRKGTKFQIDFEVIK